MVQSFTKRSLFRPLPTILLVGLSIASASCVARNDEPLASSDPGATAKTEVAAPAAPAAPAATAQLDAASVRALHQAFPKQLDRVLGRKLARGFVSFEGGFARPAGEEMAMHLDVRLPQNAQDPIRLITPGGQEIRVRQIGVEAQAEQVDRAVAYKRAHGMSFWSVTSGGAEEWLHLEEGAVPSDLDIAAEWEIEGAKPKLVDGHVALMDDKGVALGWVMAPEAYGAEGRTVDLRLDVEGQRIELFADAQGEEVLIDPGWVAVAPTAAGRAGASVVALQSGNVVFAHGILSGGMATTATQIYNPGTNMWAAGGNTINPRYGQRECLLTSGRVLVTGGNSPMGIVATAEISNAAASTWTSAGAMTGARQFHNQVAISNDRALIIGGYDGTNMLASVQIYNGATNMWAAGPNLTTARSAASAVRLANGKVLVAGGLTGTNGNFTIVPTAELYDPATNMWSAAGTLTTPRYYPTMGVLPSGVAMLAGGYSGSTPTAATEVYDPATNTWTAMAPRTIASGNLNSAVLGTGRFLVFGGEDGNMTVFAGSDLYNPTTDQWAPAGNMNAVREESGVALLTGGDALVVNGTTDVNFTNMTATVDRYQAALSANGATCTLAAHCQSGFCVDGVCCTVSACTASDACHNAGTCQAGTGICSNPNKPNNTACSDGNACTQTDSCQNGICTGANPVVCTASDQCHMVGTCNTMTGACTNPAKPNNTACNDNNACTQTDSCQNGTCTGASPVVCTASDQCHVAGTCNTTTGICDNPLKPNNSVCNDGNACTATDTCQGGVCSGANPVVCSASDQCHNPGVCDTMTGMCSNPSKPNNTVCNDGNACTQTDSCQNGTCTGATPVVCMASDQCHVAGTCNTMTGACDNPAKPNNTACNDSNACTQTDSCQNGTCTGANPVTCTASDQCHNAGTCNAMTGMCDNPAKPNNTVCNDSNACTQTDSCQNGTCTGAN
ncbi:MAG TPA: kelch repeat-containing protein, partial [Polyangium sp.]|nr:kelch repeat-containing protein [Polyangium sp.]